MDISNIIWIFLFFLIPTPGTLAGYLEIALISVVQLFLANEYLVLNTSVFKLIYSFYKSDCIGLSRINCTT